MEESMEESMATDFSHFDPVRLWQRGTAAPAAFAGLAQVRAYWEALRGDGGLPDRAALDPRGLGGVLDRIFLAEGIGRGLVQVRIAGSALAEFARLDLRGLPLSCLFAPVSRPVLACTLETVLAGTGLAELDLSSDRDRRRPLARLLLLPLCDGPGRHLVLGALGFAGASAARGKLLIAARREEALTRTLPAAPEPEPDPGPSPIRRRGHLALVHSA